MVEGAGATGADVDAFLDGRLRLRQTADGHRVGTDAVLLAATLAAPEGFAVDAGAGVGAAGLMLALRAPALRVTLIEIDPASATLARSNIDLNGLAARVDVVEADLLSPAGRRAAGLEDGCADVLISNPPWQQASRARLSPDLRRALAHVSGPGGLEAWIRALAALARADARMAMIVRGEDLSDLLAGCNKRFGDLAILPVHSRDSAAASRLLCVGRKGSRARPRLLPGLILHEASGGFTARAAALHRGDAILAVQ